MPPLPVMLNVAGKLCVVVGGGPVALRRVATLLESGAGVKVVAPDVLPELAGLKIEIERRPYRRGDLDGAMLVVVATDDVSVNEAVTRDARECHALVNRADGPDAGDLTIPAHSHHGPVTIAVSTNGISATAGAAIRRELSATLDPDWPRLLEIIAPFRKLIHDRVVDPEERQQCLAKLAGPEAMRTLKEEGPAALRRWCELVSV